ncbi:unnamed protein product [Rotaria sp. Silwood1]|nr:unnamed protein product [Rotaria sp. Silwood1]
MSNNSRTISGSHTWFNRLSTEIILEIFDYLSNNDIIYTFFYLNRRLHILLLQYQRFLSYVELPTSNLRFWKNIFSIVGTKIQTLKIIENDSSISLDLFPNLTSLIIISSPHNLAKQEQFESILQSDQFKKLHSLKIKFNELFLTPALYGYLFNEILLLQYVFNNENSLHTLEYSYYIHSSFHSPINNLKINLNLHSLTLKFNKFQDLFSIIKYTPNLKYLNIKSNPPYEFQGQNQWSNINKIQLKQFYLTFNDMMYGTNRFFTARRIDFHQLINTITQFSSSLLCLSLNLIGCYITSSNDLPFNGIQLQQQFLQSMTQLKQFHLYALLTHDVIDIKSILTTFRNKFWFDHNWIVGMHDKYLYTWPFSFDKLYDFIDFNHIYSNNSAILKNNSRIWYNVKFIKFKKFNLNLLKRIKIQMPNLLVISIDYFTYPKTQQDSHIIQIENLTLDRVTTVHLMCGSLVNEKQWLINTLPNLKHLTLVHTELPLLESELTLKLTEKIEHLVIDGNAIVEQFKERSYIYFSNLKELQLKFDWRFNSSEIYNCYANTVMKLLEYFKKLKTLSITFNRFNSELSRSTPEMELQKVLEKLDKKEIEKTYEIACFRNDVIFSKKILFV